MKKDLIKEALSKLDNDFSNIDEVYTNMKNSWLEANPDHSELDFMDSFDFSNGYDVDTIDQALFTEPQLKNIHQLSTYLGKKKSTVARTPNDHYKSYLKSKRFKYIFQKPYKYKEFQGFTERLSDYKKIYYNVLPRLSKLDKIRFKDSFCDQLKSLLKKQNHTMFKTVITDTISDIEAEYLEENPRTTSSVKHQQKQEPEKFSDLITHEKSVEIAESIKTKYKNIKGKRLKLLLLVLQDLELLPKERIASKFHNICNNEFDWDIASYTAMNGYQYNDCTDKKDFNKMEENIKAIMEAN